METKNDSNKKNGYIPFLGLLSKKEILDGMARFKTEVIANEKKVVALKTKKSSNQLSY